MKQIRRVFSPEHPDADMEVSFSSGQGWFEQQPQGTPRVDPGHCALPAAEVHRGHSSLASRIERQATATMNRILLGLS